jgi:hypothetical protein
VFPIEIIIHTPSERSLTIFTLSHTDNHSTSSLLSNTSISFPCETIFINGTHGDTSCPTSISTSAMSHAIGALIVNLDAVKLASSKAICACVNALRIESKDNHCVSLAKFTLLLLDSSDISVFFDHSVI